MGRRKGKEPNRRDNGAIGANKVRQIAVFPFAWTSTNGVFDGKCDGLMLKHALPTVGVEHFSKQVSKNCTADVVRACGATEKKTDYKTPKLVKPNTFYPKFRILFKVEDF